MKDTSRPECPRTEQISALVDGEIAGDARVRIEVHVETCPLCGAMLKDFTELRSAMRPLSAAHLGIDLASLIDSRLGVSGKPERPPERYRKWGLGWQLVPSGLAAASVLTAGIYLGALLAGATGITVMQPAAMALFDAVPPGGLCVGVQSCYPIGK